MRKIPGPFLITSDDERCRAPTPKYDSVRIGRPMLTPTGRPKTFTFGNIWCKNVLLGNITNHDKLIAHGMELRLGSRSELSMVPFGELLKLVQAKLKQKILEDQRLREKIMVQLLQRQSIQRHKLMENANGKNDQTYS